MVASISPHLDTHQYVRLLPKLTSQGGNSRSQNVELDDKWGTITR